MTASPRHLHVDKRIVGDVDRIADFTEELVDSLRLTTLDAAACTDADDEWEGNEDAQHFVETVGPTAFAHRLLSHPGHAQEYNNQQRTPPEAATHLNEPLHAREQQSAEEGIEQTSESYLQLVGSGTPTSHNGIAGPVTDFKESEEVDVQTEHHRECSKEDDADTQCHLSETTDHQGVKDIGNILPLKRPCGTVEWVGLCPASNVHRMRHRNHRESPQHYQQHQPWGRLLD